MASKYQYLDRFVGDSPEEDDLQAILNPVMAASARANKNTNLPAFVMDDKLAQANRELGLDPTIDASLASAMAQGKVQRQEPVSIEGNNFPKIPVAAGYDNEQYTSKPAQSQLENTQNRILDLDEQKTEQKTKINQAQQTYDGQLGSYNDQLDVVKKPLDKHIPDMDYDGEMRKLRDQYGEIKDPQSSLFQDLFTAILPVAFAASSEAGAMSAPKSQASYQAYQDKKDLNIQKNNQGMRDSISKRIEALAKAKEQDINQFNTRERLVIDKAVAAMNGGKEPLKEAGDQLKNEQGVGKAIESEINKMWERGAMEPAKTQHQEDQAAANRDNRIKTAGIGAGNVASRQQDARDERFHNENMRRIDNDPNIRKYRANFGNLEQARTKLLDPNVMKSPEILQDVQRLITSAMGNTGSSGIDERKVQNAVKGLGISATELKSWLTTTPQAVDDKTRQKMTTFFMNLLNNEKFTTQAVIGNNMKALTSGHESIYARRSDLQSDLMNKIKNYNEFAGSEIGAPPPQAPLDLQSMTREQKIKALKDRGHQ